VLTGKLLGGKVGILGNVVRGGAVGTFETGTNEGKVFGTEVGEVVRGGAVGTPVEGAVEGKIVIGEVVGTDVFGFMVGKAE